MLGTVFATLAVLAYLVVGYLKRRRARSIGTTVPSKAEGLITSILGGVVASNGAFHFSHGVLDLRDFPAPFAVVLGGGIPMDISNILWGLINLSLAVIIWRGNQGSRGLSWRAFWGLFSIGLVTTSLLLRFVLLPGYFETHPF